MNKEIDVTIYCLTYNHKEYIRDAMEGFIKQNTEYTFHVFVYDDASTDGTSDILREYKIRYPQLFDIYISDKNLFTSPDRSKIMQNLFQKHIVGRYVAMCEGDDYWTDTNKLQEQIDYLEEHPECVMVAHGCNRLDCEKHISYEYRPYSGNQILIPEQVIMQKAGNLPTASLVMRKEVFINSLQFIPCDVGDVPMQLYALYKGQIYYIDKIMSVYRMFHENSWTLNFKKNVVESWKHRLVMADFLKKYDEYTNQKFHEYIKLMRLVYLYSFSGDDSRIKLDTISEYAQQVKTLSNHQYDDCIGNQVEMFMTINDVYYLSQNVIDYTKGKRYVILMGTGNYSKQMREKLEYANISMDGYVVSDNQTINNSYIDAKPVWRMKEYPYNWEETALIIAINGKFQSEIENVLSDMNISAYSAPYWITV